MAEGTAPQARRYKRRTVRVMVDYVSSTGVCCEIATTLGAGGMFIETDSPLRKGTMLKLRFTLPGRAGIHEIEGRVAWAHVPVPGTARVSGMGVEFRDRAAIAQLTRELQSLD
jgi:uncharacterized protein (TIGR02266 family)